MWPQELTPHRLDLIGDLLPRIERADHGPQAVGRADRGQPGHPGSHHEHRRRWHLPGGSDLTGEQTTEVRGRLDHRAVPPEVGHRGQHIEGLRARDAGHCVHRQGGDAARPQRLHQVGIQRGRQERNQDLPAAQALLFTHRGRIDAEDDVAVIRLLRPDDLGAGGGRRPVGGSRGRAGPGLDGHVIPEGTQLFDGLGCRRGPARAGWGLLGHNDAHGLPSSDGLASERTYRHRPALTYPM